MNNEHFSNACLALYSHITGGCPKEVPPDVEMSEGCVVGLETCRQLTQTSISGFIVADIQTTPTERETTDVIITILYIGSMTFFQRCRLIITLKLFIEKCALFGVPVVSSSTEERKSSTFCISGQGSSPILEQKFH